MDLLRDRRKQLRQRLKEARVGAGLRQVDVADALGRPQSYVAKIESGERKVDFVEVLDLCAVIGLDPTALAQELGR
jgi:transcriptional regulator with XRE-family HTH domain